MPRKRTTGRDARPSLEDRALPKYSIAVASDLSGTPQQQLRRLEESGLLTPGRTDGNTRRYSDDDMARIAEIGDLAESGVNAEGIRQILALRAELAALRAENEDLRRRLSVQK